MELGSSDREYCRRYRWSYHYSPRCCQNQNSDPNQPRSDDASDHSSTSLKKSIAANSTSGTSTDCCWYWTIPAEAFHLDFVPQHYSTQTRLSPARYILCHDRLATHLQDGGDRRLFPRCWTTGCLDKRPKWNNAGTLSDASEADGSFTFFG